MTVRVLVASADDLISLDLQFILRELGGMDAPVVGIPSMAMLTDATLVLVRVPDGRPLLDDLLGRGFRVAAFSAYRDDLPDSEICPGLAQWHSPQEVLGFIAHLMSR